MLTLIVGGSASGKSAFAENYAMEAGENRIYIATMQPMDNECLARIEKHRGMRAQKNFQTVECYTGLKQVRVPKDSVVLLECMSNLTANEIYAPEGVGEDRCSEEILIRLRFGIWISSEKSTGKLQKWRMRQRKLQQGVGSGISREEKSNDFDSDRGIFDVFGNSDAADRMDK